jgi:AraC-like DNA-binding protein
LRVSLLARRKGERHWRTPTVTAYTAEGELQAMLRESPELLPGEDDWRPIVMADEFPVNVGAADLVGVSVTEICFAVGCSSLGTFSSRFTDLVGMPPSTYRRHAARATAGCRRAWRDR